MTELSREALAGVIAVITQQTQPGGNTRAIVGGALRDIADSSVSKADTTIPVLNYLDFLDWGDEEASPDYASGRCYHENGWLNVMTRFADVTIQVGGELQADIHNDHDGEIANGSVVYASGAQGQRLAVNLLANSSDDDESSCRVIGLTTHDIANNGDGRATTFGLVHDLPTNVDDWAAGDRMFSSDDGGGMTNVIPPGDKSGAQIGVLMNRHPTQGTVFVNSRPIERLASTVANLPADPRLGRAFFISDLGYPKWWDGSTYKTGYREASAYSEFLTPTGTTSATLEDIAGASFTITLTETRYIAFSASFELQTQSGASASTIGVAVNVNGVDHDEMRRTLSGASDLGIGSITHRSDTEFAPGTYTIKLRQRRIDGVSTPGVNKAHMHAWTV